MTGGPRSALWRTPLSRPRPIACGHPCLPAAANRTRAPGPHLAAPRPPVRATLARGTAPRGGPRRRETAPGVRAPLARCTRRRDRTGRRGPTRGTAHDPARAITSRGATPSHGPRGRPRPRPTRSSHPARLLARRPPVSVPRVRHRPAPYPTWRPCRDRGIVVRTACGRPAQSMGGRPALTGSQPAERTAAHARATPTRPRAKRP